VEATVGPLGEVSVNNGARVEITGSVGEASLSVNNGAHFTGESFEAVTVRVDANNGAIVSVCATGTVTGEVNNGARLTVLCGGNVTGVETANGGSVSAS
jgi:hypothetical protein